MIARSEVVQVIFSAIDDLNRLLPKERRLKKAINVALSGAMADLDSLGLINLIVATEQKIQEKFNLLINLADERAMSLPDNPLRTVETFADYITLLLEEKKNA